MAEGGPCLRSASPRERPGVCASGSATPTENLRDAHTLGSRFARSHLSRPTLTETPGRLSLHTGADCLPAPIALPRVACVGGRDRCESARTWDRRS